MSQPKALSIDSKSVLIDKEKKNERKLTRYWIVSTARFNEDVLSIVGYDFKTIHVGCLTPEARDAEKMSQTDHFATLFYEKARVFTVDVETKIGTRVNGDTGKKEFGVRHKMHANPAGEGEMDWWTFFFPGELAAKEFVTFLQLIRDHKSIEDRDFLQRVCKSYCTRGKELIRVKESKMRL